MSVSKLWRPVAVVAVALMLTASAPAPQDKAQSSPTGFVLEAGEHELTTILESASKFLGRNYFWPELEIAKGQARITIQKKMILDAIGCEEVVSQLLYMKGFAIVPVDPLRGMYEVVSTRGARVQEISINASFMQPDEVLRHARKKIQVLTNVPLKHLDAARASQQLRPFFAAGGGRNGLQFGNAGSQASILLQGYAGQVAAAVRLLREVDKPSQPRLDQNTYTMLQTMQRSMNRQVNKVESLSKRVAELEAQLAAMAEAAKKK